MLKRNILLGCMALLIAAVSSCIFDPAPKKGDPPPPQQVIKDLTNKTDVLNNIEFAYNRGRPDVYDALLDDNFTFFYTEGDIGGSGTPVQWGRDVESTATTGLIGAATKIDMDITWEDGVQWLQQVSGTETWYYTTVFYHFTIKIGETTYIPNSGAKAQFTVRDAGTPEKAHWQLVEFRDLGGPS